MSNYTDYFSKLAKSTEEQKGELDYGHILNYKFGQDRRNYFYTHPNQLRTMTAHHSKKVSHSKQNDLMGAMSMLFYKPPQILPISTYEKQVRPKYGSGKDKPFVISETENKPKSQTTPIASEDDLLRNLVNKGQAKVHYQGNTGGIPPSNNTQKPIVATM
jgi:hypothetical protein